MKAKPNRCQIEQITATPKCRREQQVEVTPRPDRKSKLAKARICMTHYTRLARAGYITPQEARWAW